MVFFRFAVVFLVFFGVARLVARDRFADFDLTALRFFARGLGGGSVDGGSVDGGSVDGGSVDGGSVDSFRARPSARGVGPPGGRSSEGGNGCLGVAMIVFTSLSTSI